MPSCRIPFCDKKCNYDKNRHLFGLPKDEELVKKWHEILGPYFPKKGITKTTRICNLHFRTNDIETKFKHVIDGRIIEIDRERARLVGNAIPIYNLPTEEEMRTKRDESRGRPSKVRSMLNTEAHSKTSTSIESPQMNEQSIDSQSVTVDSFKSDDSEQKPLSMSSFQLPKSPTNSSSSWSTATTTTASYIPCDFETIYASENIELPPLWAIHRCPERSKIVYSYMDLKKMAVTKLLVIDKNYTISIIRDGRTVSEELLQPQEPDTIKSIERIVEFIDQS